MNYNTKVTFGKTGLIVGQLGISSSFGAPSHAYEEAFERGCNYFTWGTFIKGRSSEMKKAIRNITQRGQRENLVIALYSYAHSAFLTEKFLIRGLKALGVEYTDVLILGFFNRPPRQSVLEGALKLKEKGLIRFLGLTSHNRKLFSELLQENIFDIFHVRYNAANRGAETDIFPHLPESVNNRPGIVSFTATRWRYLLNPKKMPEGETPLTAADCYRFVMENPHINICMMGAKNIDQMRENLKVLDMPPLTEEEMNRIKRIGDYVYQRK
ncbi:hypothetical protein GF337_01110 [candidate division KSB1 bacterium]|nr:hypothetical protein [candidate division KSB1 bacterium]